jgi:hypothetical protein
LGDDFTFFRERPDGEVGRPSLRPAKRAVIARNVALSEVISPFSSSACDRMPRSGAGEAGGRALPTRNVTFRPGGAPLPAREARLREIPSKPTSRFARFASLPSRPPSITAGPTAITARLVAITARPPAITARLVAITARPPAITARPTAIPARLRRPEPLYPHAHPLRCPFQRDARAPSVSTLEQSASSQHRDARDARPAMLRSPRPI